VRALDQRAGAPDALRGIAVEEAAGAGLAPVERPPLEVGRAARGELPAQVLAHPHGVLDDGSGSRKTCALMRWST
jgi:hypothetical protein